MQTLKFTKKINHDSLWIKIQVLVEGKAHAEIVSKVNRGGLRTTTKFMPEMEELARKISEIAHSTMNQNGSTYGELLDLVEVNIGASV